MLDMVQFKGTSCPPGHPGKPQEFPAVFCCAKCEQTVKIWKKWMDMGQNSQKVHEFIIHHSQMPGNIHSIESATNCPAGFD